MCEGLGLMEWFRVNSRKLETGLGTITAGIPFTQLVRIEASWVSNTWAPAVVRFRAFRGGTWSLATATFQAPIALL